MKIRHLALVSQTNRVSPADLMKCAAALQRQATRDFGPVWGVSATVSAFAKLEDVPLGYWPIIVMDDINEPGAAGFHTDKNGQPLALVQFSASWQLTCSHEALEMLADPFGNSLQAGDSVDPKRPGRVEYLVEVCDPCEDQRYAYSINGVPVSDFYTPHYFDPVTSPAVRYSFRGAIQYPRQVLPGGYLSWRNPVDDVWYQMTFFSGPEPTVRVVGRKAEGMSIREWMDANTAHPEGWYSDADGAPPARRPMLANLNETLAARATEVEDTIAYIRQPVAG